MLVRARGVLRRFSATMRDRLGIAQAEGRDVDVEQAILRVVFGAAILLYAGYLALTEPEVSDGLRLALFAEHEVGPPVFRSVLPRGARLARVSGVSDRGNTLARK